MEQSIAADGPVTVMQAIPAATGNQQVQVRFNYYYFFFDQTILIEKIVAMNCYRI